MSLQRTLKALSDPIRREILNLLKSGPMAAGDISARFEVTGAAAPDTPGGVSLHGSLRVGATLAVVPDLALDIPGLPCYYTFNN